MNFTYKCILWVAISKLLVLAAILFSGIGLMPDEAQYWTWSRELSYGYYSKPCGIAWQIASGCLVFGNTELGVRIAALVLSFFLSLAIYQLALRAGLSEERAFWSSVSFSFSPLGVLSGFFATTDCAYVLFWTCAAVAFISSRPMALGIVIAIGSLWKWPIYVIWIPVLLFTKFSVRETVRAMALSLIGLIPSLVWNLKNGFATFRHVGTSINVLMPEKGNPLDFLGAQLALVSPLLFALIVYAFIRFQEKSWELRFCWWTSVLFFAAILLISCVKKVQGNWAIAAYPTAFIILTYMMLKWMRTAIALSVVLLLVLFSFPALRLNPLRQGLGWHQIEPMLLSIGYKPATEFLFSDRYQWTSILSFYGPEQKRAFFFNIRGLRKNQFDYWPMLKDCCVGKNGWFVSFVEGNDTTWAVQNAKKALAPYFQSVTALPPYPIEGAAKKAVIIFCSRYNGKVPAGRVTY